MRDQELTSHPSFKKLGVLSTGMSVTRNPIALGIMYILMAYGKNSVTALAHSVEKDLNTGVVSQHLKKLREAGLVLREVSGQTHFYSIDWQHPFSNILYQMMWLLAPELFEHMKPQPKEPA